MIERPERLSDEQVAETAAIKPRNPRNPPRAVVLAREVQAARLLLNGGPCPTCCEVGTVLHIGPGLQTSERPCRNPNCVNGRVLGVAERLKAARTELAEGEWADRILAAVIADIRRLAGES